MIGVIFIFFMLFYIFNVLKWDRIASITFKNYFKYKIKSMWKRFLDHKAPESINYEIHCKVINPSIHGLGQKHISLALTVDGDKCPSKELLSDGQAVATRVVPPWVAESSSAQPPPRAQNTGAAALAGAALSRKVQASQSVLTSPHPTEGFLSSCLAMPSGTIHICYLPPSLKESWWKFGFNDSCMWMWVPGSLSRWIIVSLLLSQAPWNFNSDSSFCSSPWRPASANKCSSSCLREASASPHRLTGVWLTDPLDREVRVPSLWASPPVQEMKAGDRPF